MIDYLSSYIPEYFAVDIQERCITIMKTCSQGPTISVIDKYIRHGNYDFLSGIKRLKYFYEESMLRDIEKKRVPDYIKQAIKELRNERKNKY